jgi:hypothetical protein
MIAGMSLPGSPLARLPPRVPQYRTCGSAISSEVSRMIGQLAASRSEPISSCCVVIAPMTRVPGSLRMTRSSLRSCMSTRCSGLARRSFIIGIRLCPPATTRASWPCCVNRPMASCRDCGRWYANGAGINSHSSHISLPHDRVRAQIFRGSISAFFPAARNDNRWPARCSSHGRSAHRRR